ncbi:MAG TPA: MFS transporter [Ktedonobacteraceae bacterium]
MSMTMNQARAEEHSSPVFLRMGALLLTAVAISANFTNYGPLIPVLQGTLHINGGEVGLFSTLLYGGIACSYLPGGILADRYGARRVLLVSLLLVGLGGCLLPLYAGLPWMALCRLCIGLGAGAAMVAGSQSAARLGHYAALGQGLFGGAMQLGAGLGLFVTPQLLAQFGWQGAFLTWGALGLAACFVWSHMPSEAAPAPYARTWRQVLQGFRSPTVLCLGLVHLGTLGLGQALAPWLALYFAQRYGLPIGLAAALGAIGLLAGIVFRPLGGVLLARQVFGAVALIRMGTILACTGVLLLALPVHIVLAAGVGIALFAFGTTLPYAAVFSEAGRVGRRSGLGTGTTQGVVSLLSAPASALGPPLIGLLVQREGSFSLALGALSLVGLLAIPAALLAGPVLTRTWKTRRTAGAATKEPGVHAQGRPLWSGSELDGFLRTALTQRTTTVHHPQQWPAEGGPLIVMPGFLSRAGDGQRTVCDTDAHSMQRLLEVGGMPVILPLSLLTFQQDESAQLSDGEEFFRRLFDEVTWPFFCQMVLQQARGVYLPGYQDRQAQAGDTPGSLDVAGNGQSKQVVCTSLALLAALLGMPVLGGEQATQKAVQRKAQARQDGPMQASSVWSVQPTASSPSLDREEEARAVCSQFVATCKAYRPLPPDALPALQEPLYTWLRQRQRAFVHQTAHLPATSDLQAGTHERNSRASASRASLRLHARQHKLRAIRGTASWPEKSGTASIDAGSYVPGGQFATRYC